MIEKLLSYQDLGYKEFTSKIIPSIEKDKIIGVRVPILRKMAKEMVNDESYKTFISSLPHSYYEEDILHACILSLLSFNEVLIELDRFLPYIDNWSVCDLLIPKSFKNNDIIDYIKKWLSGDKTYTIRFGLDMLIKFYTGDKFSKNINNLVMNIKSNDYYVNMAISWYFSYALINHYDETIDIIESRKLDKFIQNKTIQKVIDSYRVNDDIKNYLKTLRTK